MSPQKQNVPPGTQVNGSDSNVVSFSSRKRANNKNDKSGSANKTRILVVGADNTTYRIIAHVAKQLKAQTYQTSTSDKALDEIETAGFNLIIMVYRPPVVDAFYAIQMMRFMDTRSRCKFMVLHDLDKHEWEQTLRVNDVPIDASLPTPFDPFVLKSLMSSLFAQSA